MISSADLSVPATPHPSQQASTPLGAVAFELDYLVAKLTAICEEYGEELDGDLAHDLHSVWDSVHVARTALSSVPTESTTVRDVWPDGACDDDFDDFTDRWDRANEPIGQLLSDKPAWAVAEWAAARTRYELVFVDAVRHAPADRTTRVTRLREAEAELDRACEALRSARTPPAELRSRRRQ